LNNTREAERTQQLNNELARFNSEVKDLDARFTNELENVAKTLSDKYHHNFPITDLLAFQKTTADTAVQQKKAGGGISADRQSLVGTWLIDQNWYIYHYNDGRLYMYFTRLDGAKDSTYGTWQLTNNQLYHYSTYYFNAGNNWVYDVSDVSTNSFSLKLTTSPFTNYVAKRYN
jgi:hypothetical protein